MQRSAMLFAASWNQVFGMHIARVYCVEAGKVVDIYQARALFFAQEEPRRRFQFLCSDDACRNANRTRVTGVNYDKLVEDGRDRVVVKPHFRTNPETPHSADCEWMMRERVLEALNSSGGDPQTRGQAHHFRHVKSSDVVDVFLPASSTTSAASLAPPGSSLSGSATLRSDELKYDEGWSRRQSSSPTRADFLEAVVSVYELLEPDERRAAVLRIGRGRPIPYSRAFCRINHYCFARGERIFHGGVRVRLHGPNFAVRFFDRVMRPDQSGKRDALEVSLYLKRNTLLEHWNGKFLIAQLSEAAKPGHYAHCYFFGRLQPHAVMRDRLVIVVESLDRLAFTVRRTAAASKGVIP
jgi:hypothetical protein